MPFAVPALDQVACASWNENEIDMYNSMPFYFSKYQVEYRKTFAVHSKMTGKRPWIANQGPIMRGLRKVQSPHLRQEATPQEMQTLPKVDYIDTKEMTVETTPKRQRFRSRMFPFLPSFRDFLKDHVMFTLKDINEKILRFDEIFVRTGIFHMSPYVFVAGTGVITPASMWDGKDMSQLGIVTGKTVAERVALKNLSPPQNSNLSLDNVFIADSIMREDLRVPPYSGGGMQRDSKALAEKNVLVCSNEAYTQFIYDPFLQRMKTLDLNVITEGFQGDLFGRVVCRIEDLPLRMLDDGTFPQVETREVNPNAYNINEPILTEDYKNSPWEWGFLYGAEGYEEIEVGPPPADFTGNTPPENFAKMSWNGETRITKNFLVPCLNEDGNEVLDTNEEGEHLQIRATGTYGLLGTQRRNVLPILFRRQRGNPGG